MGWNESGCVLANLFFFVGVNIGRRPGVTSMDGYWVYDNDGVSGGKSMSEPFISNSLHLSHPCEILLWLFPLA